jgi:hypothetical protein
MTAEPITSAIHNASASVQKSVAKTETAAVSAVERATEAFEQVKVGFDGVKAFGAEVLGVVDTAGRAAIGGVVAANSSLVNYGKDAVTDTIDVGRKSFEVTSVTDLVDLHASFAERRMNALFQTVTAINTIHQNNVMAMWTPFASMLRDVSEKTADATAKTMDKFKTAA